MTTEPRRRRSQLLVVYDADCGFCRCVVAALLLWDRRRALSAAPYAEVRDRLGPHGLEEEPGSWYAVTEPGVVLAAGEAFPALLARLPGGGPLAWATRRFPRGTESAYRLVARNRSSLGRLIPRSGARLADRAIAGRPAAAQARRSGASRRSVVRPNGPPSSSG